MDAGVDRDKIWANDLLLFDQVPPKQSEGLGQERIYIPADERFTEE